MKIWWFHQNDSFAMDGSTIRLTPNESKLELEEERRTMVNFNFMRRVKAIQAAGATRSASPTPSMTTTTTVIIQEEAVYDERNRSMTPKRPYLNRSASSSNRSPTTVTALSDAPPLQRVGASIGHGRLAIKFLLDNHVPGVLIDEELGIVAMFQEIHQSLVSQSTSLQDMARATTASVLAAWARIQEQQAQQLRLQGVSTKSKPTGDENPLDEDISMAAMFREARDNLLGSFSTPCQDAADGTVGADGVTMLDAMLANMLHTVACERQQQEKDSFAGRGVPKDEEDLSMGAMFREIARLLPGGPTEQEVEQHMVSRVEHMITSEELQS